MMDQSRHKLIDTLRLHPRCRTIQGSRRRRVALSVSDWGEHPARRVHLNRGVARVGMRPILGIS